MGKGERARNALGKVLSQGALDGIENGEVHFTSWMEVGWNSGV